MDIAPRLHRIVFAQPSPLLLATIGGAHGLPLAVVGLEVTMRTKALAVLFLAGFMLSGCVRSKSTSIPSSAAFTLAGADRRTFACVNVNVVPMDSERVRGAR